MDHIIVINEEGLLPQCVQCGIFQSNVSLEKNLQSEDCKRYAQIKNNKRLDRCNKAATNVKFQLNGNNIKKVDDFKYLGRIIDNTDDNLKAVENQLKKARAPWGRIGKILKSKQIQISGLCRYFIRSLYKQYYYMAPNHGLSMKK